MYRQEHDSRINNLGIGSIEQDGHNQDRGAIHDELKIRGLTLRPGRFDSHTMVFILSFFDRFEGEN